MRQPLSKGSPLHAYLFVGKRFRTVANQMDWKTIGDALQPLWEAYDSLQKTSKLAAETGSMTADEKIANLHHLANDEAGKIARAAMDLHRELNSDFARETLAFQMTQRDLFLGGHLKTGHKWTVQNRPTEWESGQEYLYPDGADFGKHFL